MHPVPPNEALRLQRLEETGLLFSEPSRNFDRLCQLAAELFEMPVAVISLVAKDIQWFKAKVGVEMNNTSREAAFCNYTILRNEVLVVSDATKDHRFARNPYVTGAPGIRFYAGAPIVFSPGVHLGTICVTDTRPRQLSPTHRKALKNMGESIGTEMRLLYAMRMLYRSRSKECLSCPVRGGERRRDGAKPNP
jgi:GAF domain-containing protein